MFKRKKKQPALASAESGAPAENSVPADGGALADIAVEAWRFGNVLSVAAQRMDMVTAERLVGQYRWFEKKVSAALDRAGVSVVDLTGQEYSVGMAATPLNLDDFDDDDLMVVQMVEPIVMVGERVIHTGSVMLGRKA